jgi:CYTH domain-containing protein
VVLTSERSSGDNRGVFIGLVDLWVLEAEVVDADRPVLLPEWLGPMTEVTDLPAWKNRALAAIH